MKKIAEEIKALSDETRLRILNILQNKELCVCEIEDILEISQTKASRHLNYLKNCQLVKNRKENQKTFYKINENKKIINDILKYLKEDIYINDLKKEAQICKK